MVFVCVRAPSTGNAWRLNIPYDKCPDAAEAPSPILVHREQYRQRELVRHLNINSAVLMENGLLVT